MKKSTLGLIAGITLIGFTAGTAMANTTAPTTYSGVICNASSKTLGQNGVINSHFSYTVAPNVNGTNCSGKFSFPTSTPKQQVTYRIPHSFYSKSCQFNFSLGHDNAGTYLKITTNHPYICYGYLVKSSNTYKLIIHSLDSNN
jgi:hypothetical protein